MYSQHVIVAMWYLTSHPWNYRKTWWNWKARSCLFWFGFEHSI